MNLRGTRAAALAVGILLWACSCGVPSDSEVTTINDADVPYRLLDPLDSPGATTSDPQVAGRRPLVVWVRDDLLVPSSTELSCSDDPAATVQALLTALAAGPSEDERADGRSTAIPPESSLVLVEIEQGDALVELRAATGVSADRLPVAVGQVALTVDSAPGVDSVRLVADGEPVPAPLPGGVLTEDPVSADDYASLVPPSLRTETTGCGD